MKINLTSLTGDDLVVDKSQITHIYEKSVQWVNPGTKKFEIISNPQGSTIVELTKDTGKKMYLRVKETKKEVEDKIGN